MSEKQRDKIAKHECVKLMNNKLRQSERIYKKLDYLN